MQTKRKNWTPEPQRSRKRISPSFSPSLPSKARWGKKKIYLLRPVVILTVLFCSNILSWSVVYDLNENSFLEVIFFDVGQGDAIFIETPQKHQILIDGGPTPIILEKLSQGMLFGDRTIDLIILTHPHYDHLAGLIEVLKSYKVKNILWTGILMDTASFEKWEKLIEQEDTKIHIAQSGQKIVANQTILQILHPFENLENQKVKNIDDSSIVIKLIFGENSFLFMGDASKSAEKELMGRRININSNVLKVGHHGSRTSSAEEFIKEVLPEMAVISAGKDNKFGHPRPETLDTLEKYGIKIFRTDLNGDIKIISDGINNAVSNF